MGRGTMKKWQHTTDMVGDFMSNTLATKAKALYKVEDALIEGYPWEIIDDLIRVENPDKGTPDQGRDDYLVAKIEDIIHLLIYVQRSHRQDEEVKEQLLSDLTRLEKENEEFGKTWEEVARLINDMPYHLPYKYQPSWMKR